MTTAQTMAARLFALVLLLCLAFGTGYFTKGQFVLADEAKQSRVVIKDSAKGIVVAAKESQRIEADVEKKEKNVTDIKAAVKKRGITLTHTQPLENCHDRIDTNVREAGKEGPLPDYRNYSGDGFILDLGTVGLLNAAREGRALEPSSSSDEKESAPSTVGVTDLVENDLEIVKMYHSLAKRHDELVDAVQKKLKEQAQY